MKIILTFFLSVIVCAETINISVAEDISRLAPKYIDILEKIYKEAGTKVKFTVFPQQRAFKEFNDGKFHAMAAKVSEITKVSKRSILVEPPILKDFEYGLVALKNSPQSLQKDFNLKNYKFVIVRGSVLGELFRLKYNIKNQMLAKDQRNAIEQLKRGRADFLITPKIYLRNKEMNDALTYMEAYSTRVDIHHVISPELLYLKPKLEEIFQKYLKKGKFEPAKLIKKD